jgi:hypothetical protein
MRNMVIKHREYISDIVMDSTGNYRSTIRINPGLMTVFPWLSSVANNFETYKFLDLRFTYVSNCGASNNGAIAIIPDYDADDDQQYMGKQDLMQYQDTVRAPIWKTFSCRCTKKNLDKRKTYYTRHKDVSSDYKDHDVCSLTIIANATANLQVGEFWCEYTIRLETPQSPDLDPMEVEAKTSNPSTIAKPFSDTTTSTGQVIFDGVKEHLLRAVDDGLYFKQPGRYLLEAVAKHSGGGITGINGLSGLVNATSVDSFTAQTANAGVVRALVDIAQNVTRTNEGRIVWQGVTGAVDSYLTNVMEVDPDVFEIVS